MKKLFFSCMLSVSLFMIVMIPASAQEKGQKKMHVVVEENGRVITDTTVIFGSDVPEEEIQATISGITGEKGHPCTGHKQPAVHCDTMVYKCRHLQKSELDTLLEVSGKPFTYAPSDTCRHAHASCEKRTEKAEAGQKPCKHMQKEVRIIETSGDDKDMPEGCAKKTIEKKIIITEEGGKAEKAIIIESPAETGKKAEKEE